jgi:hypothetical protein
VTLASTWAAIREDTIQRIAGAQDGSPAAITPTADPRQSWRHVPATRQEQGGRDRTFTDRVEATSPPRVFGAGQLQIEHVLTLETSYLSREEVQDVIAADHLDLVAALQPRSTYPTGLRVRQVDPPDIDPVDENSRVVVRYPIRHIFRVAVTLV